MFTCNQEKVLIDVKHVISPSEFVACIGEVEDFVNFKQFMFRINEWCSAQKSVSKELSVKRMLEDTKIHLSQQVLVKLAIKASGDEVCWHRGQICSIESLSQININLVDHGVIKKFCLEGSGHSILFNIPNFYNELAPQAKLCAINMAKPTNEFWSLKSIEFFNELLAENDVIQVKIANVESCNDIRFDNKKYILDVFDGESPILDKFIQKGYAIRPSISSRAVNMIARSGGGGGGFNLNDQFMNFDKRSDNEQRQMNISNDIIDLSQEEVISLSDEDEDGFKPVNCVPTRPGFKMTSRSRATCSLRPQRIQVVNLEDSDSNQYSKKFRQNRVNSGFNFGDANPTAIKLPGQSVGLKDKLIRKINQNMQYLEESDGLDETCVNQGIDLSYFAPNDPDSRSKSPIDPLPRRTFICSDETILTGYKTNTNIDAAQLSESIKFANLNRLYPYMHKQLPELINKSSIVVTDEQFNKEQQVYDIISGDDTLKPLSFKAKLLVSMYHQNKSDSKLIVRCILKEIINRGVEAKFALTLLNELKFCTKELFINEIDKLVKESNSLVRDPTFILHANSNRENICFLLSKLYACYCAQKDNRKDYFENLLNEWTSIRPEIEDQPSYIFAQNCQYLQEFLKNSLTALKKHDLKLLEMIHKNAAKYALDTTLKNDVRSECIKVNILLASQYVSYKLATDAESSAVESDTSESQSDITRHTRDDMPERYGRFNQRDPYDRFTRNGSGTRIRPLNQGFRFPKAESNVKRRTYF